MKLTDLQMDVLAEVVLCEFEVTSADLWCGGEDGPHGSRAVGQVLRHLARTGYIDRVHRADPTGVHGERRARSVYRSNQAGVDECARWYDPTTGAR